MPAADEFQDLGGGRYYWQIYDPAVKTELMSTALHADGAWFFIDPVPLAAAALDELAERPSGQGAILLTNGNHERAAAAFRDRFCLPIIAHRDTAAEIKLPLDRMVEHGDTIFGRFTVIALPGAAAGEIAYFHAGSGTLWLGDALINLEPLGFAPLPAKYCGEARTLHAALPRLLDYRFEHMVFAHGTPILNHAHARLAALIDSLR